MLSKKIFVAIAFAALSISCFAASALEPDDTHKPGLSFSIQGNDFFAGFFELHPNYPGKVTPILLRNQSGGWVEVVKYDTLWDDIQQDIEPDFMARLIVERYNIYLENEFGKPLSYEDEISLIFTTRVIVNNSLLLIST